MDWFLYDIGLRHERVNNVYKRVNNNAVEKKDDVEMANLCNT